MGFVYFYYEKKGFNQKDLREMQNHKAQRTFARYL